MSKRDVKPIGSLKASDLEVNPVWQFESSTEYDETAVRAVARVPVSSLTGKVVATRVQLAGGGNVWALIGNVDVSNPKLTEHFLTLSVERDEKWFHLARYHDVDYIDRGPGALAAFLGLRVQDVFPISYDIRRYVKGNPAALAGEVTEVPREKLSRAEIIAMAVP